MRALLREARLRAELPTFDDVEDEADDIRGAQRFMEGWEDVLHGREPDEDEVNEFEEFLHLFWKPISALEDKLHSLGEAGEVPDEWEGAVRRLTDILQGHQDLLLSFEALLHRFPPPAPHALVDSFEDVLHEAHSLLVWLVRFVDRRPTRRLVERLCRRLETDATLIGSAETLMKQQQPFARGLTGSLRLLVSRHQSLVWSLFGVIEKVPDNRRLLTRLENMLHRVHALMESTADMIDAQLPDAPLAREFEELVSSQESMLDHFERIVKARKPGPDRPLVRSFENLLRELASLLRRLAAMVEAGPDHPQIKHLERRLEIYAARLESFETIVAGDTRPEFVRSFQDLLVRFRRLIAKFKEIVEADPGDDAEKEDSTKSLAGLRDGFKKLVASLEDLKAKLPSLPPDLEEANEDLLAAMQELDRDFFALVRPGSPAADQLLAALADGARILSRFALLFGPRRRPSTRAVRRFRALVGAQRELVDAGRALMERGPAPSPFAIDTLEDLGVLQERLNGRLAELTALERRR